MLTIKNVISSKIAESAAAAFPGSSVAASDIFTMLEYPPDAGKGDLALPCFKLSRTLRRPPVQIASALAGAFKAGEPGSPVASVEAVNGYLNF
ncbi:MAG TPA: hypothetical protein PKN17_05855, partial [Bacillota bacterium]|nr:hypothetical protein [Bacillota bacterium]